VRAASVLVALALTSAEVFADEARRERMIDADGPPPLPALLHADVTLSFEHLIAGAVPTDPVSVQSLPGPRALAHATGWLVEVPIVPHAWYFGAAGAVASAAVPAAGDPGGGGTAILFANPELWGRGVWWSEAGLAAGGGLGLVLPVPRTFSQLEAEVVRSVRVVRPADYPRYQDMALAARPFLDVRWVAGPVVVALRQGLDVVVLARGLEERENRVDLTAVASLFGGFQLFDPLGFGLELAEVYQITADVAAPGCTAPCDQHRAQLTLSPSARVELGRIATGVSFTFPLSTPLRAEVASYLAGRLHLEVSF
jgi:hypothetical protein